MADRSRRAFLAASTAGLAAAAGCSFPAGDGYDDAALRRLGDREPLQRTFHHPLAVPDAMVERHRRRARTLLEAVPAAPALPNDLVARRIADERARLADALEPATATPTPEEDEAPRHTARQRLHHARRHRADAATLWGEFRAATGDVDRGAVDERRDDQRDRLAAFLADWDYRASGPVRAALVHAHLEDLVVGVEHDLEPWPPFPADPRADVEKAGYVVGKLEEAAAGLDDVAAYREQVAVEGARDYREALTAATTWLRRRAADEADRVEGPLEDGVAAFEEDPGETVARYRFTVARGAIRGLTNADLQDTHERAGPASAALFAATRRTAVAVLADAVDRVESAPEDPEVTARTIATAREEAFRAVRQASERDPPALMEHLLRPGFDALGTARTELQHGASGTPPRAYAAYRYAAAVADAATDAADELAFLLSEAAR